MAVFYLTQDDASSRRRLADRLRRSAIWRWLRLLLLFLILLLLGILGGWTVRDWLNDVSADTPTDCPIFCEDQPSSALQSDSPLTASGQYLPDRAADLMRELAEYTGGESSDT